MCRTDGIPSESVDLSKVVEDLQKAVVPQEAAAIRFLLRVTEVGMNPTDCTSFLLREFLSSIANHCFPQTERLLPRRRREDHLCPE